MVEFELDTRPRFDCPDCQHEHVVGQACGAVWWTYADADDAEGTIHGCWCERTAP